MVSCKEKITYATRRACVSVANSISRWKFSKSIHVSHLNVANYTDLVVSYKETVACATRRACVSLSPNKANRSLSLPFTLSLLHCRSLTLFLSLVRALFLSLSLSLTHTHTHSLSLSLSSPSSPSLFLSCIAGADIYMTCMPLPINKPTCVQMCDVTHSFVWYELIRTGKGAYWHYEDIGSACKWLETLQHTATHCNTLQHTAMHCNTLQQTTTHCNTLQHTAIRCNTLQHAATHCKFRNVAVENDWRDR